MVTVFASILFALPTSLVVCATRGLNVLQGSSVVLMALVALPTVASVGILLVQALRTPQRHACLPAGPLLAAPAPVDLVQTDFVARHARVLERVEG